MIKFYSKKASRFLFILSIFFSICGCSPKKYPSNLSTEDYDGPDKATEFEFNRTRDPLTGTIPTDRLMRSLLYTDSLKKILPFQIVAGYGNWTERGPNSDALGPSNGNSRANNGVASGRIRAILADAADATGKTVFIAGVDGGLWKTTDITASPANWVLVNDFFSNLAITSICQDPTNKLVMYFGTGEAYFNNDGVRGFGVWKSTDGGDTWNQLPATTNYLRCAKIACDAAGNIYLADRGNGILRSKNGGSTWTNITPSTAVLKRATDLEISNTGRLHVTLGLYEVTSYYFFTDNPATTTTAISAGNWSTATVGFPTNNITRTEIACSGNILYALPAISAGYTVPTIYKSTDGGANWAATGSTPAALTNGQGWFCLAADIDPSNSNNVIVGSLDCYETIDGGTTWTQISHWFGTTPGYQYVHADQHIIKWYDNGNKLLIGSDGGLFFSGDKGTTIRDRNVGLRIKQFYSCAIHPTSTNYFLAGAQDNGVHQFNNAGLGSTFEVTGGDGAFVAIDQTDANYQFGSYVYNDFKRSTNGGATWANVLYSNSTGQFINPWDYDNTNFKIYGANTSSTYLRWDNPRTGNAFTPVTIALNNNIISAVTVSPYTSDLVYMGTDDYNSGAYTGTCRLLKVAAANTAAPTVTDIKSASMPVANVTVSCIAVGSTDNYLMACFSNYGIQRIWVSTNGGTSWTNIDGNLPDMPVRWCMFVPGHDDKALIATEAGVYLTTLMNGGSTSWLPSPTFPTVRTDMLKYRASDGLVAATTHGRGLWTQPFFSILPLTKFLLRGKWSGNNTVLQWEYTKPLPVAANMDIEISTDAVHFAKAGSLVASENTSYSFTHKPDGANIFYRIKAIEGSGIIKYSNTIKLFKNGSDESLQLTNLYPNPVQNNLNIAFIARQGAMLYQIISASGQTVWRKEEQLQYTGSYQRSWDIKEIKPGIYFVSITSNSKKVTHQFVKK